MIKTLKWLSSARMIYWYYSSVTKAWKCIIESGKAYVYGDQGNSLLRSLLSSNIHAVFCRDS